MGASYGSVQVYRQTQNTLRDLLEDVAAKRKSRFWIGPTLGNWIGIYPVLQGTDPSVARDLARKLGGELFYLMVHHDDVFAYEYYQDGKRVDQYCSQPDYIGQLTVAARKAVRGRPQTFEHLAADPEYFIKFQDLIAVQADQPAAFASELLVALARALGIANVQTSYEYLSDGETDVEGWNQFLHAPDLRIEQVRARKADTAHQEEVRRLIQQGLLLAERGGHRGRDVPFLHWCPAPDGAGFLVVAAPPEFTTREPVPLDRIGPPWSAGPKPTGLMIDPTVQTLVSSATGRFVAMSCLDSDPSASVWDVGNRQCVAKLARGSNLAGHVTFMPDESAIICSCNGMQAGPLTIVPIGSGEPRVIPWPRTLKMAAAHPNGRSVAVVEWSGRLSILDLPSEEIERTLFAGGVRAPAALALLLGDYPRDWFTMPLDMLADWISQGRDTLADAHRKIVDSNQDIHSAERESLPPSVEFGWDLIESIGSPARINATEREARQALATSREPGWLEQKAFARELIYQIAFDSTGERLFAATEGGLRVYRWSDCIAADFEMPASILATDADSQVHDTADEFINIGGAVVSFAHDPDGDRLLYGGADGRVRSLDLITGQTEILLEPPGLRPIQKLALSLDRTVLAVACGTDMIEDASNRPMRSSAAVQFWDYRAQCSRQGSR